jgi:hypothetical protein
MKQLLPFLIPPLVGAIIGYVTNRIAIGMLFRPYREKRLAGIRLPFTPGIIPRQRYRLSESIGKMVSTQLFTEDAVRRQVQSPEFQSSLRTYIGNSLDRLFDSPVKKDGTAGDIWDEFAPLFGKGAARAVVRKHWHSGLRELFPAFNSAFLLTFSRSLSSEKRPLAFFVPYHSAQLLSGIIDDRFEELAQALDLFLRKPRIRTQLEIRGRFFLEDVFGHLSSMQRLMLMAGQYDRSLMDKMPGIVENALVQLNRGLKEPEVRQRIIKWIRVTILSARKRPVSDLFRSISGGGIEPEGSFAGAVSEIADRLGNISISSAAALFSLNSAEECADALSSLFFPPPGSPRGGFLETLMEDSTPGKLFELSSKQRDRLSDIITGSAASLLEQNVEVILQHINVHTLVVQKIDDLEVEKVEDLLLVIIKTHLKYINLFGALLGAIIGALQLLG